MSKILIVEDEVAIADLEKDYLELSGFEVEIENDGEAGLKRAISEEFDLFILDLMLPGVDGFEICKKIRETKNTPVIMISAKKDDIDKIRGLGLGADDYITKPFSLMVLVSKVQAFMRRMEGVCGHNRILSGNIEVNYGEMRALKRNADGVTPLTLSKKELQIMIYFMENARQILSKEQILEYVWDVDGQFVDDNTVPVNISRLKGKIGNDYIQNVRGMGYIWTEESVQE